MNNLLLRSGRGLSITLRKVQILLAGLLLFSNIQAGEARNIAKKARIEGRHEGGYCLVFAKGLVKELRKKGYNADILGYRWQYQGKSGLHCVVIFQDTDKRYFLMDNEIEYPILVSTIEPYKALNQFYKGQATITEVEIL